MNTLLQLKNIWKFFDGVSVLKGVNIDLKSNEIHALLGGNGSGKSTLMKIISGSFEANKGSINFLDREVSFSRPYQAHKEGIYLVPQEPKIFPSLSILENITVGIDKVDNDLIKKIESISKFICFNIPLEEEASTLTIANQQLLEIIRGLIRDSKVLILDEPTSTLTVKEVNSLFDSIKPLVKMGIGVFFISHRINEIFNFSNRVSILRDGKIVLSGDTKDFKPIDLIKSMIGEKKGNIKIIDNIVNTESTYFGDTVLEVKNISSDVFRHVSFSLRASETLGIAGIVGAGRTELAQSIIGMKPYFDGSVELFGKTLPINKPKLISKLGVSYIPEDRHKYGIFLDLPHYFTTSSSILDSMGRFFINKQEEKSISNDYIKYLNIKILSYEQESRMLSGGNQQKIVLSKILATKPKVIILDEPTRGVDAEAREEVFSIIDALKKSGVAIILISSDLEEIINHSDRIIVIHEGSINLELNKNDFDIERITQASFGVSA